MPLARPLACGIIRLPGRGLEALPTLGRLRDGLSQWRNRLPRVSRERLARVYEGGFALSDREPQSQASGAQGPEWLPKFDYYLDESDPDVVVLRRQDGTFVAAFSASGVTREGILQAAKEDYAALLSRTGSAGEGPDPGGTRGGGGG
jgi:hypothetical protein